MSSAREKDILSYLDICIKLDFDLVFYLLAGSCHE
jgi:hypothetical protein